MSSIRNAISSLQALHRLIDKIFLLFCIVGYADDRQARKYDHGCLNSYAQARYGTLARPSACLIQYVGFSLLGIVY